MSEVVDIVAAMTNAYYFMQLEIDLSAEVTDDEIAELRWHLRLGPRPKQSLQLTDEVNLFYQCSSRRGDDPALTVDLSPRQAGGWRLTAWQEPEPAEVDQLVPLFRWLEQRADPTAVNDNGSVCLGRVRFYDEDDWTHSLLMVGGSLRYPRLLGRPVAELLPGGSSAVSSWDDFTVRLHLTLAQMRDGDEMMLRATGNRFAQFSGDQQVIACEVSGNGYVDPGYELSAAGEATMRNLGWQIPLPEIWAFPIHRPVDDQRVRAAAEATTKVLRDVFKIAAPQDLLFSAQSLHIGEEPDVSAMGLPLVAWT